MSHISFDVKAIFQIITWKMKKWKGLSVDMEKGRKQFDSRLLLQKT